MATLRSRLTVAYGFALVGDLIVFAVALLLRARRASGMRCDLGPIAVDAGRSRALRILRAARRAGSTLTDERPCGDDARAGARARHRRTCSVLLEPRAGLLPRLRPGRPADLQLGRHPPAPRGRPRCDRSRPRCSLAPEWAAARSSPSSDPLFGGRHAARRAPRSERYCPRSRASSPACPPRSPS